MTQQNDLTLTEPIPEATPELPPYETEANGSYPDEESVAVPLQAEEKNEAEEELTVLREEVARLRQTLSDKEAEQQKTLRELGEFNRLFPDVAIKSVPKQVWSSVSEGIPLCAAYALYEKKIQQEAARAEGINRQNASRSAGQAGRNTAKEYFSPDEVRAMSQKQVHESYAKIMASMKHWN